ncbi:8570_t:CDS:1, partial [Entrophospora sp. SA101]
TTKTTLAEPTEHIRIGGVAFILVLIPLLLSLLSAFAFYVGEQRAAIDRGDINGSNHDNHNENMCTGFTNQPPVSQYQQYNNDQS